MYMTWYLSGIVCQCIHVVWRTTLRVPKHTFETGKKHVLKVVQNGNIPYFDVYLYLLLLYYYSI